VTRRSAGAAQRMLATLARNGERAPLRADGVLVGWLGLYPPHTENADPPASTQVAPAYRRQIGWATVAEAKGARPGPHPAELTGPAAESFAKEHGWCWPTRNDGRPDDRRRTAGRPARRGSGPLGGLLLLQWTGPTPEETSRPWPRWRADDH
jgi:hypothetical protein